MGGYHGYGRSAKPRGYRSRRLASKTAILYKRPSARNQQSQLLALAAKVRQNERKIKSQLYLVQHRVVMPTESLNRPVTYGPYSAWSLNNIAFMGQIFGDAAEATGGKYTGHKMKVEFNISMGKSIDVTNFTAFIVRPRNSKVVHEVGMESNNILGPTGTTPSPLLDGTDYSFVEGLALMNPKRWHIDKHWKFQIRPRVTTILSGPTTSTNLTNQANEVRKSCTIANPMKLNSRTGVWSAIEPWELNPSQRSFLVLFSDATTTTPGVPGPGPLFQAQVLLTAHTSQ